MIRTNLLVTPHEAADLVKGTQRAILLAGLAPEEISTPELVLIACPEIGWTMMAVIDEVISAEPLDLLRAGTSRKIDVRQMGTTKMKLLHLCFSGAERATVLCIRRVEDVKTDCNELDDAQFVG